MLGVQQGPPGHGPGVGGNRKRKYNYVNRVQAGPVQKAQRELAPLAVVVTEPCCLSLRCAAQFPTFMLEITRHEMLQLTTRADRKAYVKQCMQSVGKRRHHQPFIHGRAVCNDFFKKVLGVSNDLIACVKGTPGRRASQHIHRCMTCHKAAQ